MLGYHPPGSTHNPGSMHPLEAHTPWEADSGIWSMSSQYASYWNACLYVRTCDTKQVSLPSANEVCKGYVFTRVCLYTGGCLGLGPGGRLRGLVGRCLGPDPGGRLGVWPGEGVSRPRPRGMLGGLAGGCVQAQAWSRTPAQQTATAVGGMHPTGMHSCYKCIRVPKAVLCDIMKRKYISCESRCLKHFNCLKRMFVPND